MIFRIASLLILSIIIIDCHAALPRTALVIGNGAYSISDLKNPINDAKDMAQALRLLNFEVKEIIDSDKKAMISAIDDFSAKIAQKGGVGFFYYAGHGMQINGINYLLPTDIQANGVYDIEKKAVSANSIIKAMEVAKNPMNIIVLDACRNNPFTGKFRMLSRGLSRMEGPSGTFMAFSTAPGSIAADGSGLNGLYTQYLLQYMMVPGLPLESVFKKIRINVEKDTNGKQVPWESSSLKGDFFFIEPSTSPKEFVDSQAAIWEQIKSSNNLKDVEEFILNNATSPYLPAAQLRLQRLKRSKTIYSQASSGATASVSEQAYAVLLSSNDYKGLVLPKITRMYHEADNRKVSKQQAYQLRKLVLDTYLKSAKLEAVKGDIQDRTKVLKSHYDEVLAIDETSAETSTIKMLLMDAYFELIQNYLEAEDLKRANETLNRAGKVDGDNARLLQLKKDYAQLKEKLKYNDDFIPVM